MRLRWMRRARVRGRVIGLAAAALLGALIAVTAWQFVQAQQPPAGAELEWVNQEEDWIERKKHGQFRARPIFNRQLATLYYGLRDSDTGEWLTAMYRVSGGEKERDEGWEYEFDYPALDEHEALDPDKTYLIVILAAVAAPGDPDHLLRRRPDAPAGRAAGQPAQGPGPGRLGQGGRALGDRGRARHALRRA